MTARNVAKLLAVVLVVSFGCGGGGGGGGTPTTPPPPGPSLVFTPSSAAGPGSVSLRQVGATSGTVLTLEVVATDLQQAYAFAFDLDFPDGLLTYQSATEGAFLNEGGTNTSLQVAVGDPGRLVVGLSRLGDVGGVSGSGVIMTLRFSVSGPGSGTLGFSRRVVFDTAGNSQSGISWVGGSVNAS